MGDQGMGCRCPTQMLYVFAKLTNTVQKDGGIQQLDILWLVVQNQLMENQEWMDKADSNMTQEWNEFLGKVNLFDLSHDDQIDSLTKFMTELPRNIQDPVSTRWHTIIECTKIFLDTYVTIYFLDVGIKYHYKSDSYCWKLDCTLISLMNERVEPTLVENQDNVDYFINSFTDENMSRRGSNAITPGKSPTFYKMLLFHRAFCEYAFDNHFLFLLRNDPFFGVGTFGQLARFMPERVYVICQQLYELKDDKWKNKPEFAKYLEALKGIPKSSKSCANKEFFEQLPIKFMENHEHNIDKHILNQWRSDKLLPYMIGGDPRLARELAMMLLNHNCIGSVVALDDKNEEIQSAEPAPAYIFDDHKLTRGPVQINVKKCMEYIMANADLNVITNDEFVKKHWNYITKLADADEVVCLTDKLDDGE